MSAALAIRVAFLNRVHGCIRLARWLSLRTDLDHLTTGMFEAMLETLAEMVERDASADMIDSTVIRAHHCAVGIKRDSGNRGAWAIARRLQQQTPRAL